MIETIDEVSGKMRYDFVASQTLDFRDVSGNENRFRNDLMEL